MSKKAKIQEANFEDGLIGDNAKTALKEHVERIERLEDEKKGISDDITEMYRSAKNDGFDTKILRKVVARRRKTKEERENEDTVLSVYEDALEDILK